MESHTISDKTVEPNSHGYCACQSVVRRAAFTEAPLIVECNYLIERVSVFFSMVKIANGRREIPRLVVTVGIRTVSKVTT